MIGVDVHRVEDIVEAWTAAKRSLDDAHDGFIFDEPDRIESSLRAAELHVATLRAAIGRERRAVHVPRLIERRRGRRSWWWLNDD